MYRFSKRGDTSGMFLGAATSGRLRRHFIRHGLTFVEMMIAVAIMAMMSAGIAALARAVQISSTYADGVATATQHARVAIERIQRAVSQATANENFRGAVVFSETIGGQIVPDTLVVWYPSGGAAANPSGLPLFSEIVVYCPNPAAPNQLLEITAPGNTRTVPALTDTADWATDLAAMKAGTNSTVTLLTDLMRLGASVLRRQHHAGDGQLRAVCGRYAPHRRRMDQLPGRQRDL